MQWEGVVGDHLYINRFSSEIRYRRMDSVAEMDKTILYLIYGSLIYVYLYRMTTFRRTFLLNFYGPILGWFQPVYYSGGLNKTIPVQER